MTYIPGYMAQTDFSQWIPGESSATGRQPGAVAEWSLEVPFHDGARAASTVDTVTSVPMTDPPDDLSGALSGRYTIQGELGRGGMATVYRAHDLKFDRAVAIKVIRPELTVPITRERFLREVRLAAPLQHPNILPIFDSGEAGPHLYYVMPLVEGESLRDRLAREGQLPVEDAVQIGREVAGALAYAHRHGVVHRDIKPENILLSGGHAVVADFGIARGITVSAGDRLTETGLVVGTPAYMSPEQASARSTVDPRSDIYSLGCVLYEMLAGMPPFTGPTPQAVFARHSLDAVPPLRTVRDTVPQPVEAAIVRALAKSPADRHADGDAFARALSETASPPLPRPLRVPRRAAIAAVAAVALIAAWGSRSLWSGNETVADAAPGGPDPRRIAVRYFEDLSRDRSLGPLADGLTETLIERLAGVSALDVISKHGVAAFRGSGATRDSVARALEAGSLIEGSVEQTGPGVRVTVRLVDGSSGADIDRASFERSSGDALRIQDDLTDRIATFLRRRLGEEVRLRERQAGTASVDAWLLVQRAERARKDADSLGRTGDMTAGEGALARADSLLAGAEAADPAWLEPVVLRATVGYQRSRPPFAVNPEQAAPWIEVGLRHAERALDRSPNDSHTLELRGTLRYWSWILRLAPDPKEAAAVFQSAEQDLRASVRLDPSRAGAWSVLSHLDATKSDLVQSKLDAQRGYEADAYYRTADIVWRLFTTSYDLDQIADAVHWCDEGGRRFPDAARFVRCRLWLLTARPRQPDVAEAWRLVGELRRVTPPAEWPFEERSAGMFVAAVLARAGLGDSARHLARRSRADEAIDPNRDLLYYEAFVRTLLGDRDEAFRLLKEFLAANPEQRTDLAQDYQWWFRDLRSDSRYEALAGSAER